MKKTDVILEVICCAFILLFGYTAVSKFLDFSSFRYDIGRNFPFLHFFEVYIAVAVPSIELIIAVCLIVPRLRKAGLYASMSLMCFFTLYVARILSFSKDVPCTCGGVLREMTWEQHLWFNIFFTCLALVGIWFNKRRVISKGKVVMG